MIGFVTIFLLGVCIAAVALMVFINQRLFETEEQPRLIQVAPVVPLEPVKFQIAPTAPAPQKVVSQLPGLVPASLEEAVAPQASAEVTASPTPTPTATASPIPARSGIATRLVIPKLNLDRPVLFAPAENGTWQVGHLEQSVGHLEGTASPGSDSNLVLAGHVTLDVGVYGPFANLGQLAPGDTAIVYEGDKTYFYLIESQRTVNRTDVAIAYPSTTGQITLITCTTWNGEEGRYSQRLVVKGRLLKG